MNIAKFPALLLAIFFLNSGKLHSQNFSADTGSVAWHNAVNVYHQFLSPEPGLYNGSEYVYTANYPSPISEGHPFFIENKFDTGEVFYNNVLYKKVPLLYDIITDQLLIKDPSNIFIIRLHNENVDWFRVLGHIFVKINADNAKSGFHAGFYELLSNGNISLYKKDVKTLDMKTASEVVTKEQDVFFIKSKDHYYLVKNKKSLLALLTDNKKDVQQFIRKSKLNFRKDADNAFTKTVEFYNGNKLNN